MANGIVWMSLMRFAIKCSGLISTVVLVRLLVPADFGLIAMAMSVITALELLRAFNFESALIQNQGADRSFYDTAWTLSIVFGVLLGVLVLVLALPAAQFYGEPRLRSVMQALAISTFITGFENIGVVAFRKDLTFHKEFALRIGQKLCTVAITLPLAFALRSYWALVIGMISGSVCTVVISYIAHPFRPRPSLAATRQLMSFSKWLLANDTISFLRDHTADFLIGRISGANALAMFSMSFEIATLPTTELVGPINRAALPAYSKMSESLETLRRGFLDVIGLVALVALPAGFGIAASSGLIVGTVLGDKWLAAIPLMAVLAIFGGLNALTTNCIAVHLALGRPRTVTMIGLAQIAFLVPALIWSGYYYGAIGVAWAYLAYAVLLSLPLNYAVVMSRLELRAKPLASLFWRPAIGTAVMYVVVHNVARLLRPGVAALLLVVALGAATYAVTVAGLWLAARRPYGPEQTVTSRFVLPMRRRFAGGSAAWALGRNRRVLP